MKPFLSLCITCVCLSATAQNPNADSVINQLRGTWHLVKIVSSVGYIPVRTNIHVVFHQDADDSINKTISYLVFRNDDLMGEGHSPIDVFSSNGFYFIAIYFDSLPPMADFGVMSYNPHHPVNVAWLSDTLYLGSGNQAYLLVEDTAFTIPPPMNYSKDHVISLLKGSWKWFRTFNPWGGDITLPHEVHVVLTQDEVDSVNQTISYYFFEEENVVGYGHTTVTIDSPSPRHYYYTTVYIDSLNMPYLARIHQHLSNGTPFYFWLWHDTLSIRTTGADVSVHYFIKDTAFVFPSPDDTTSSEHVLLQSGFIAHPNPTNGIVSLKATRIQEPVEFAVYNTVGKQCLLQTVVSKEIQSGMTFDLTAMNGNVFYLKMRTKDESAVVKILKF